MRTLAMVLSSFLLAASVVPASAQEKDEILILNDELHVAPNISSAAAKVWKWLRGGWGAPDPNRALDSARNTFMHYASANRLDFLRKSVLKAAEWRPGHVFRDCPECPEMVVVPAGSFMMGTSPGDKYQWKNESPRHRVTIPRPFAVGKYEVTFAEWDACVTAGGCGGHRPNDRGWGRGRSPVIDVSWKDAQAYVRWLSRKAGKQYRLLSEAEWEYAARAGTTTPFHFGRTISTSQANYAGSANGVYRRKTVPVGSFPANAFGLHDVHGNVWEWVADCWNKSYRGAPTDGSAWTSGNCAIRVLRGGSWSSFPRNLRSANRLKLRAGVRFKSFGFRVARTLTP